MEIDTTCRNSMTYTEKTVAIPLGNATIYGVESITRTWWSKWRKRTCSRTKKIDKITGVS